MPKPILEWAQVPQLVMIARERKNHRNKIRGDSLLENPGRFFIRSSMPCTKIHQKPKFLKDNQQFVADFTKPEKHELLPQTTDFVSQGAVRHFFDIISHFQLAESDIDFGSQQSLRPGWNTEQTSLECFK